MLVWSWKLLHDFSQAETGWLSPFVTVSLCPGAGSSTAKSKAPAWRGERVRVPAPGGPLCGTSAWGCTELQVGAGGQAALSWEPLQRESWGAAGRADLSLCELNCSSLQLNATLLRF